MYDRNTPPEWWGKSPEDWAYSRDVVAKLHVGSRVMIAPGYVDQKSKPREVRVTCIHHNTDGQRNGIVRVFPTAPERGEWALGEWDLGALRLDIDTIQDPPRLFLEDIELLEREPRKYVTAKDGVILAQFQAPTTWEVRVYDAALRRHVAQHTSTDEYDSDRWFHAALHQHGGEKGTKGAQ